jgi:alcohol dehydrogenase class IV
MTGWDPSTPFTWRDGERVIVFGRGVAATAAERIEGEFSLLAGARALAEAPGLAAAASEVHPVPAGLVDDLAGRLRGRVRGGVLVALGGGRVIDVAKALAAADPPRRVVAIPTTLSGAEMTAHHRLAEGAPPGRARVRPALVIADPLVMASQPEPARAASAANALGHALEAPLAAGVNPLGAMAGDAAAGLLARGMAAGDAAGADALALGAVLAGYAIGSCGYGLHHVVSQTLARHAGVPHALANATMLPHTVVALGRRAGRPPGPGGVDAAALAAAWAARAGVVPLREAGVPRPRLAELAALAAARAELADTPPAAGRDEILALYEAAW